LRDLASVWTLGIRTGDTASSERAKQDRRLPTMLITNTRSQAEIWYQLILEAKPQWAGQIALHHGSLDKEVRDWVEQGLKAGQLKAVVATSSL
jgi:ATP-dependent helicase Lhr and Lhr-like helicase